MKKFIKSILIVTTILSLVGCGSSSKTDVTSSNENSSAVSESQLADENISDMVFITDEKGSIEFPKNISRIAVFDMSMLETIDALEIPNLQIAAPVDSLPSYLEKYKTAVNAGGIKEPNFETLFEFDPELIIISGRQEASYDQLSEIAPTWYAAVPSDFDAVEFFNSSVRTLAQIFPESEDKAIELMNKINDLTSQVIEKTNGMTEKALTILTNDGKISTYGRGSRFGIIYDLLNVPPADVNIEVSTHGQEVSYEYIAELDPDIIFVVDRTKIVSGTIDQNQTLDNDLIKSTKAYKNNKIIELDAESWYLSGAGAISLETMLNEVLSAVQ